MSIWTVDPNREVPFLEKFWCFLSWQTQLQLLVLLVDIPLIKYMEFSFSFHRSHASMLVSIVMVGTPLSSNNPTSIINYGVMSLTFLFPSGIMPRINISRVMGWNFHVGTQDMHLISMLLQGTLYYRIGFLQYVGGTLGMIVTLRVYNKNTKT